MKKIFYWLAATLVLLVGAGAVVITPTFGTCSTDDEIDPDTHSALEQVGLRFVREFIGDNTASYGELTSELKQVVSEDSMQQFARQIERTGPLRDLRVTSVDYLHTIHWGKPAMALCMRGAHQASVAIGTALRQAHVIVEGDTPNQTWAFALWLMPEDGWRVQSFHAAPSRLLGKSASDFRDMARAEKDRGHNFNSAILYATARDLAFRGPSFQPRAVQEIAGEMAKLPLPAQVQGQAPFKWHSTGADFTVMQLRSTAFTDADGLYLSIAQQVEPGTDDELERRNQALITYVQQTFPEYASIFAGLAIEAQERGTHTAFRSLHRASVATQ